MDVLVLVFPHKDMLESLCSLLRLCGDTSKNPRKVSVPPLHELVSRDAALGGDESLHLCFPREPPPFRPTHLHRVTTHNHKMERGLGNGLGVVRNLGGGEGRGIVGRGG